MGGYSVNERQLDPWMAQIHGGDDFTSIEKDSSRSTVLCCEQKDIFLEEWI